MKNVLVAIITWIKRFLRDKLHLRSEELPYYITIAIALILFGVGLKVFIELTDELAENELGNFDSSVSSFIVSFRSAGLTSFFKFMTDIGDRFAYIVITIILGAYLFFRHKNWKFIAQTVLVLVLSTLTNILLKSVINRARPAHEHLVEVNTLSFPSGHSMSAMAFYGFLTYLTLVSKMAVPLKISLVIILCVIILSIGISRIYLGVHFPSDVAAGFIGGLIWVTFCIVVFNIISLLRKRKSNSVTV
jgi:membrane-associated phospholipid phosphatase